MPRDGCGLDRSGAVRVIPTACPRPSSVATETNSPTAVYCSDPLPRLVRRPDDDVTGPPCSRRVTTSRTGRSPTLVTVAVTVTVGSLDVVTTSGVTLSRRSFRNSAPGSPAAVGGTAGTSSSISRPKMTTMIRGATATRSSALTRPNRSRSSEGRRTPRRGSDERGCANGSASEGQASLAATAAGPRGRPTAAVR